MCSAALSGMSRWTATQRTAVRPGRRGASRDLLLLLPILVLHVVMNTSPTLANEVTEIDTTKMTLIQTMTETTRSMCIRPLEASQAFRMLLRMEVKPVGPGSNRVHIAGSVVVSDSLQVGAGWSHFTYEYTAVNKELFLRVHLNDTVLPYKPARVMYSGRYQLNAVKMYIQGRMEMMDGDQCLPSAGPTEPPTPPQRTTPLAATDEVTQPITIFSPDNLPPHNPTPHSVTQAGSNSWVWSLGAAGPVPVLVLVVVAVLVAVLVTTTTVVLCRRRSARKTRNRRTASKKQTDPFTGCNAPLMAQTQGSSARTETASPQVAKISTYNPLYKAPKMPMNGTASPSYYGN